MDLATAGCGCGLEKVWTVLFFLVLSHAAVLPEQLHISYSARQDCMWASWAQPGLPPSAASPAFCEYLQDGGDRLQHAEAVTVTYSDNATGCRSDHAYGGPCVPWNGSLHTAELIDLSASAHVRYRCGSQDGMTEWFGFASRPPPSDDHAFSFAVYGDQGASMYNPNGGMENFNHTYPGAILVRDSLLREQQSLRFVHVMGDIAYANGNQPVWDGYGRDMQRLFATVPALMSPGNHDGEFWLGNSYGAAGEGGGDSGISYALRFPGPGPAVQFNSVHTGPLGSSSMYYSVDSGPAHLVVLAGVLSLEAGSEQHTWLETDLKQRSSSSWTVVSIHYPLYCTLKFSYCDTGMSGADIKQATPPGVLTVSAEKLRAVLEPLFLKYGVDAVFTAHNHAYERTHPVSNLTVTTKGKKTADNVTVYHNPGAPVYWVTGTGGADPDAVTEWRNLTVPWMAFRAFEDAREASNWGWSKVTASVGMLEIDFVDAVRHDVLDRVQITR